MALRRGLNGITSVNPLDVLPRVTPIPMQGGNPAMAAFDAGVDQHQQTEAHDLRMEAEGMRLDNAVADRANQQAYAGKLSGIIAGGGDPRAQQRAVAGAAASTGQGDMAAKMMDSQFQAESRREIEVLKMADTDPEGARVAAQYYGLQLPEKLFTDAQLRRGAITAGDLTLKGAWTPQQGQVFLKTLAQTRDENAAMQAAGLPMRPAPQQAPRQSSYGAPQMFEGEDGESFVGTLDSSSGAMKRIPGARAVVPSRGSSAERDKVAVYSDLLRRAESGDPQAKQLLDLVTQSKTNPEARRRAIIDIAKMMDDTEGTPQERMQKAAEVYEAIAEEGQAAPSPAPGTPPPEAVQLLKQLRAQGDKDADSNFDAIFGAGAASRVTAGP